MLTETEALKILELPEGTVPAEWPSRRDANSGGVPCCTNGRGTTLNQYCSLLGASLEDIKESYKRLAMLWHPERQTERNKMLECTKKFQAISAAYIYLMSGKGARDKSDELSFREMQELFKRVFIETLASNGSLSDDSQDYVDDDDVDDDYFDDEDIMCSHEELEMLRRRRRYLPKDTIFTNDLPPEEISKNAAELIIEEEREKKRAEKRRAKKKRRRDKKKQGKMDVHKQVSQVEPIRCSLTETAKPTISSEDSATSANEDDAFDPNSAFEQVLKLDDSCEDARNELLNTRVLRIMEMGFTREQAEVAIKKHETVPAALDNLLSSHEGQPPNDRPAPFEEIVIKKQGRPLVDDKANLPTPLGLTSLWVGNVLPEVTEKKLLQIFSKCGPVASVRCLPDKYCAFVNYKTKEGAIDAMTKLQGVPCAGQNLLIRYPDHPNPNGYEGEEGCASISRSCSSTSSSVNATPPPKPAAAAVVVSVSVQKATGPVNGDECYFWRTTGCQFGDQCRYKHVPAHKGLDRKPWHKPK